jgi:2,3,4,5-tetrahydropyridine-2-carboxylate N-succinyltransferase
MQSLIESAFSNRSLLSDSKTQQAIKDTIAMLDEGTVRVAQPIGEKWEVNNWVKQAVIMYFQICEMKTMHAGPLEFYDKMDLKNRLCVKSNTRGATCCCALWRIHCKGCHTYAQLCKYWGLCR